MAKAADVVVQCLENEGVQYVFGIPGEENLDLLESLRKSQIRLVLTRHEQSAGFMAATYGRLTGKTGVSLSTLGPGATNLVTAGAYAYLGGMPMLMITGQKPIKKSKQGRFQILDVVGMMQPLTKYTHQLASADNIPSRVREAFRLAEEEKPGAVHLELPEDIAAEQTDSLPIPPSLSRRPLAEYKAICAAVEKLRAARSPILVIGAGANRKMTAKVLKQLIDKTGIPFVTTQMGKGVVDERHPRFLGNAALSAGDFVHRAVEAADLIVNVGHDVIEKPPFFMVRGGTEVIHVNFRSAEVDPVYFPQIEVWATSPTPSGRSARRWTIPRTGTSPACWRSARPTRRRSPKAPTTRASRSTRSAWWPTCAGRCRRRESSPWTTACTRSGSPATTRHTCPTPCCWTTPSPPWAPACPRRWPRTWSTRTGRSSRCAAMAAS